MVTSCPSHSVHCFSGIVHSITVVYKGQSGNPYEDINNKLEIKTKGEKKTYLYSKEDILQSPEYLLSFFKRGPLEL